MVGLLVVSHWILDFVSHRPDMPLTPMRIWQAIHTAAGPAATEQGKDVGEILVAARHGCGEYDARSCNIGISRRGARHED